MSTVRFTAEIGQDQAIHPPAGVRLALGKADIIVVQAETAERSQRDEVFSPDVPEIANHRCRP